MTDGCFWCIPFETAYRVRADYEQFLWCFFQKELKGRIQFTYGDILIADYEGGGFSETKENRELSAREHKEIVARYMTRGRSEDIRRSCGLLWRRCAQGLRAAGAQPEFTTA